MITITTRAVSSLARKKNKENNKMLYKSVVKVSRLHQGPTFHKRTCETKRNILTEQNSIP